MPVRGQDVIAKNIVAYGGGFLKHVNKQMKKISKLMDEQVQKNASLTDHSLQDLKMLGHPYSKRNPQKLHEPDFLVHKQSGKLLESKYSGIKEASISLFQLKASAYVGFDKNIAPHAVFVIFGTSRSLPSGVKSGMVARDVLSGSVKQIENKAVEILRTNLKDFNFRFRGALK